MYINFRGLQASDAYGAYGSSMSETMIAFNPDEVSTIVGGGNNVYFGNLDIRPLNFADLPCPPQDVMVGRSTVRYLSCCISDLK